MGKDQNRPPLVHISFFLLRKLSNWYQIFKGVRNSTKKSLLTSSLLGARLDYDMGGNERSATHDWGHKREKTIRALNETESINEKPNASLVPKLKFV